MNDVDPADLPHLAAAELRLLWVNDWYDGPLEAVVEHDGKRYLMVLHGKDAVTAGEPMQWILYRMSPEQWTDEDCWHALFEEHVGHHWCFDHEPPPGPPELRDPKRFYDLYAKRSPRTLGTALGWVDEMPAR